MASIKPRTGPAPQHLIMHYTCTNTLCVCVWRGGGHTGYHKIKRSFFSLRLSPDVRIKQNGRRRELFFFEWRRLTSSPSSPPTQNLEKILQLKPPSLNQCPTTKRRCWNSISFLSLLWWGAQFIPWLVELRTIAVMLSSPQLIRKFVFKKEIEHFLLRRLMFIQSIYWTLLVVCRFRKNCAFFFHIFPFTI